MTDILPKNPRPQYQFFNGKNIPSLEHIWWQHGQDETMKALRPGLERMHRVLQEEYWADSSEYGQAVEELEQILKESE